MSTTSHRSLSRWPLWLWAVSPAMMILAAAVKLTGQSESWFFLLAALATAAARIEQPEFFQKRRTYVFHWVGGLFVLIAVAHLAALLGRSF